MLELGPRPTLLGLAQTVLPDHAGPWLASLRPDRPDWEQMLGSLGALALAGSVLDWRRYDQPYNRHKTALPTYPFQRQRFWHALRPVSGTRDAAADLEALAAKAIASGALSDNERAALPGLLDALKAAQASTSNDQAAASHDTLSTVLYEVSWRRASAPGTVMSDDLFRRLGRVRR